MNTQQLTLETSRLMTQGGKVVDKYDTKGNLIEVGVPSGLTKGYARKLARKKLHSQSNYIPGNLGSSEFANLQSRKERRKAAKENKSPFFPEYNGEVKTYEEMYGVGYERFNNKFVTIAD
ncbi:hypothetical protein CHH83_01900 [Bacillus sp. 7586-K]|nr:hypothetical protein CHH83_01900 [Bacillus sp. 7586-K]